MREMKDSGIEWIGKIPHCWNTSKLKYLGQYINGYAFKPEEWGSKGVPIIRIQDLTGSNDNPNYFEGQIDKKYGVENGDILISWAATLDAFIWNKGNGWLNQHIFKAVPNRRIIDYDFFFWMIKESMKNMNNDNKHGIFMQHVTLSVFNNFTIPMPPLAEQHRIAAFLDRKCAEIDAVLEKTRASIEEYKKLKQAVITQAVTKGIRGDRPMKDSGIEWIGEIPAEWKVNLIKNVATTGSGGTPESGNPSLYDGDINWICSYDLKERPITKSERRLTQLGADSIAGNVQLKGSVLVAMYGGSGTIGNSGILECEAKTNQAICSIKFNNGYITDYFGFYYILSIRKYWMLFAVGTRKDPNISQDIVRKMPCILPPIAEQEEIVAYCNKACDQLDTLITKKQQYLTEIENYKKSLIYEYVTGKREV